MKVQRTSALTLLVVAGLIAPAAALPRSLQVPAIGRISPAQRPAGLPGRALPLVGITRSNLPANDIGMPLNSVLRFSTDRPTGAAPQNPAAIGANEGRFFDTPEQRENPVYVPPMRRDAGRPVTLPEHDLLRDLGLEA